MPNQAPLTHADPIIQSPATEKEALSFYGLPMRGEDMRNEEPEQLWAVPIFPALGTPLVTDPSQTTLKLIVAAEARAEMLFGGGVKDQHYSMSGQDETPPREVLRMRLGHYYVARHARFFPIGQKPLMDPKALHYGLLNDSIEKKTLAPRCHAAIDVWCVGKFVPGFVKSKEGYIVGTLAEHTVQLYNQYLPPERRLTDIYEIEIDKAALREYERLSLETLQSFGWMVRSPLLGNYPGKPQKEYADKKFYSNFFNHEHGCADGCPIELTGAEIVEPHDLILQAAWYDAQNHPDLPFVKGLFKSDIELTTNPPKEVYKILEEYDVLNTYPVALDQSASNSLMSWHPVIEMRQDFTVKHLSDPLLDSRQEGLAKSSVAVIEDAPSASPVVGTKAVEHMCVASKIFGELLDTDSGEDALFLTGNLIRCARNINPKMLGKSVKRDYQNYNISNHWDDKNLYLRGMNELMMYSFLMEYMQKKNKPLFMVTGNHDAYQFPCGVAPRKNAWQLGQQRMEKFDLRKLSSKAYRTCQEVQPLLGEVKKLMNAPVTEIIKSVNAVAGSMPAGELLKTLAKVADQTPSSDTTNVGNLSPDAARALKTMLSKTASAATHDVASMIHHPRPLDDYLCEKSGLVNSPKASGEEAFYDRHAYIEHYRTTVDTAEWIKDKEGNNLAAAHNLTHYEICLAFGCAYSMPPLPQNFNEQCFDWFRLLYAPLTDWAIRIGEVSPRVIVGLDWGNGEAKRAGHLSRANFALSSWQMRMIDQMRRVKSEGEGGVLHVLSHFPFIHYGNIPFSKNNISFSPTAGEESWVNVGSCTDNLEWFFDNCVAVTENQDTRSVIDAHFSGHGHKQGLYQVGVKKASPGGGGVSQDEYFVALAMDPYLQKSRIHQLTHRTTFVVANSSGAMGKVDLNNEWGGQALSVPASLFYDAKGAMMSATLSQNIKPRLSVSLDAMAASGTESPILFAQRWDWAMSSYEHQDGKIAMIAGQHTESLQCIDSLKLWGFHVKTKTWRGFELTIGGDKDKEPEFTPTPPRFTSIVHRYRPDVTIHSIKGTVAHEVKIPAALMNTKLNKAYSSWFLEVGLKMPKDQLGDISFSQYYESCESDPWLIPMSVQVEETGTNGNKTRVAFKMNRRAGEYGEVPDWDWLSDKSRGLNHDRYPARKTVLAPQTIGNNII
ncbi:MAG: hypothetical protein LBG61_04225 [Burkholderiales bacterium]|jgi:hypothetical protein|nr:hypothetical protein [Burkholderiales bacterium]